jgi:MFS family permease
MSDRLFTPRFVLMFGYSFTVFISLFQLLPAAPYRVLALGGSTAVAGLFHGALTFSSALSAPFTGAITDRIGHRVVLIVVSLMLTVFAMSYAFISSYELMFVVACLHGLIWSGLLSASGAYMTATIPSSRRGEGLGYWGLASVLALGTAPAIGFWVYRHGWLALCSETACLNLLMALIAWRLPDDRADAARMARELSEESRASLPGPLQLVQSHVEWRVLLLAIGLTMVSFGYGALTSFSALFVDALHVSPRSLFLTTMAASILIGRLTIGRTLDRIGHRRVLIPSLLPPAIGLLMLAMAQGRGALIASALVYGIGFGLAHPAYTALLVGHVPAHRRGAAFGAILAAFDMGIGSGASLMGWIIDRHGFRTGFALAGVLALISVPYFLFAERRFGFATPVTLESVNAG